MPGQLILWTCPICRIRARVPATTPRIHCCCGYTQEGGPTPGLGDYVAIGLHKVGVTRERYVRAKRALGLKGCGCGRRQRKLNELGRKVGIGKFDTPHSPPSASPADSRATPS